MHYIRFLKPPRVYANSPRDLTAKITVTTDLGESFLAADIAVIVELEDGTGACIGDSRREYSWKGSQGMRALEVAAPIVRNFGTVKMLVRPKKDEYGADTFAAVLTDEYLMKDEEDRGAIVAIRSMAVDLTGKNRAETGLAERVFSHSANKLELKVHVWEETGESIARHIWDAGLVLSSYLTTLPSQAPSNTSPRLPKLSTLLHKQNLNILELGAGCGIVGLTLASSIYPRITQLLLTDLPEASSILRRNISTLHLNSSSGSLPLLAHQVLDWSSPLTPNVKAAKWDLVLVADCTYNPDVVPELVGCLGRVRASVEELMDRDGEVRNEGVMMVVAMKVRHESELVFFELMAKERWVVLEKCTFPLPVLGGEAQEIDVFVFG